MFKGKLVSHVILNDIQLKAIGTVAVECAMVDRQIERFIWHASGLEETQGKIITAAMQLSARLDLLQALVKAKVTEQILEKFVEFASELRVAIDERNTMIHGLWLPGSLIKNADRSLGFTGDGPVARRRLKAGEDKEISIGRADAVALAFDKASERLLEFVMTHLRWKPPA